MQRRCVCVCVCGDYIELHNRGDEAKWGSCNTRRCAAQASQHYSTYSYYIQKTGSPRTVSFSVDSTGDVPAWCKQSGLGPSRLGMSQRGASTAASPPRGSGSPRANLITNTAMGGAIQSVRVCVQCIDPIDTPLSIAPFFRYANCYLVYLN